MLTDGTLNFPHDLVVWDGPSCLIVANNLRLLVNFLKQKFRTYKSELCNSDRHKNYLAWQKKEEAERRAARE